MIEERQRPILRKRSHQWIDARSLALAKAVAKKIRRDPQLLDTARDSLRRWKKRIIPWPRALREWEEILANFPLDTVLAMLLEDSEEGRRRRQSSPFPGVLTPQERRAIFDHYEAIGT